MKKTHIIFLSIVSLLSLSACGSNNQTTRFNEWNLIAPNSELLYNYSDKDRGFHGDGIDSYVFSLTQDYKDYINSFLIEYKIDVTYQESIINFPDDISHEIFQIDNTEIIDYIISIDNVSIARISQKNNKLIIIIDETNERITFVFSLY